MPRYFTLRQAQELLPVVEAEFRRALRVKQELDGAAEELAGYSRHLFLAGEILYATLATVHNISRYLDIMRQIRQAIVVGTFPQYLQNVRSLPVLER